MDDELDILDNQLADVESELADAKIHLWEIKQEWEELYPYEELEFALQTIERLVDKVLDLNPEDLEVQSLLVESQIKINPKLSEPDIFYLS